MDAASTIRKTAADLRVAPNLADYAKLVTLDDVVAYLAVKLR